MLMDKKLHILHHLYGEEHESDLQELLQDEEVRAEYQALGELKNSLDQRPPQRPEASTFDAIVAAAAQDSPAPSAIARADRPARPNRSRRFRRISALATTCAVVIVVGVVFIQLNLTTTAPAPSEQAVSMDRAENGIMTEGEVEANAPARMDTRSAFEDMAAEPASPSDEVRSSKEASGRTAQSLMAIPAPSALATTRIEHVEEKEMDAVATKAFSGIVGEARAGSTVAPDSLPSWDEADKLRDIHRGIELLQARSADDAWDDPAVMSLDVLPTQHESSRRDRGLNTVGTQRTRKADNKNDG